MEFQVIAQGRRLSDGRTYRLSLTVQADTAQAAEQHLEAYDWEDAATCEVLVLATPVTASGSAAVGPLAATAS